MNKTEKQSIVDELAGRLKRARTVYVTDFAGVTVAQANDLRRRLRKAGVEYVVVKNTLAKRALEGATITGLDGYLKGNTALTLATDPGAAAKVLADFTKEHQKLAVRGGLVDGKAVTPADVKRMANLPSRDVLLAELGGALQAPMAGFLGVLQSLLANFAGALEALKTQREGAAS